MKLNKNIIHNGVALNKGEECPEEFLGAMVQMGHVENIPEQVEKPIEPPKNAPEQVEKPKKKGK